MADSSSSPKADRPAGTMSALGNMKILVVGFLIVSMVTAGFAFAPGLLTGDLSGKASEASSENFAPTPVGEDEAVWTANGNAVSRKIAQEKLKPYATQKLLDALADPGSADPNLATHMSATLSSVISAELIAEAVTEAKVEVSDEELQAKLKEFIEETFENEAAYKAALEQFELTEEGMLQQLRFPMEAERLTDARYPISDEMVQEQIQPLYDEQYKSGKVLRHIQFQTVEEADKVMPRLTAGEDFAKVAEETSQDKRTAKKGGLIGPYREGALDEAFDNAVKGTEVGKIGGPFQSSLGWHIIKVEAAPSLEEVWADLAEQARKGIQAQNWVTLSEELESKAQFTLDPRFGRWKGMAFGGITPAFEAKLTPQRTIDPAATAPAPAPVSE